MEENRETRLIYRTRRLFFWLRRVFIGYKKSQVYCQACGKTMDWQYQPKDSAYRANCFGFFCGSCYL